jgi:hypothetical protein
MLDTYISALRDRFGLFRRREQEKEAEAASATAEVERRNQEYLGSPEYLKMMREKYGVGDQ